MIKVCNINQYVSAYKGVWTDFYDWNIFLKKIFKPRLEAIKKYQLLEACYKNKATVQCLLPGLPDCVIYDNNLLKLTMTVNLFSAKPNKLYKNRIGLRDIKAVGLRENYAEFIDKEYHKERCA